MRPKRLLTLFSVTTCDSETLMACTSTVTATEYQTSGNSGFGDTMRVCTPPSPATKARYPSSISSAQPAPSASDQRPITPWRFAGVVDHRWRCSVMPWWPPSWPLGSGTTTWPPSWVNCCVAWYSASSAQATVSSL